MTMGFCKFADTDFIKLESAKDGRASCIVRAIGYPVNELALAFSDADAMAPDVLFSFQKDDVSCEPYDTTEDENQSWTFVFNYSRSGWTQETQGQYGSYTPVEYEFSTTGQTERIYAAIDTVAYSGTNPTGPDFNNGILVSDGRADGVDVPVSGNQFSEVHVFAPSQLSDQYLRLLEDHVGKTNSSEFRGRPAGEVQYLGASGSTSGNAPVKIKFHFRSGKNVVNQQVTPQITVTSKKAWQFMWPWYRPQDDNGSKSVVMKPNTVYVQTVVGEIDFAIFNIGTGPRVIGSS